MSNYTLLYDGPRFSVSEEDIKRLKKIYSSGLAISGRLFEFTPFGADGPVSISVGSGARLTISGE